MNSVYSSEELNIEKKLRVEDYRLLRQRFNRSSADSALLSNLPSDKAARKKYLNYFRMIIVFCLGTLNKEEFIGAFETILDQNEYRHLLEKLFHKVFREKELLLREKFFLLVEYKRDGVNQLE
jgi:hypothetical protein